MKATLDFDVFIANMSVTELIELQADCCKELMKRHTEVDEVIEVQ